MTNYEEKKDKVIDKMAETLMKLDEVLEKLEANKEDDKSHRMKEWYEEKKVIHEFKRLLHEIQKYDHYDEKEEAKIDKQFEEYKQLSEAGAYSFAPAFCYTISKKGRFYAKKRRTNSTFFSRCKKSNS